MSETESKDDFGKRIARLVESGNVALGLALGVSNGLLGKIASFPGPKTSEEIAKACNLKERYVREWLGLMVCGDIIEFDETSQSYLLPRHRRPFFTSGCREEESSFLLECLPNISASAYNNVSRCFEMDGPKGVPYSSYKYAPEMSRIRFQDHLIKELESFPELNEQLEKGARILDVACGKGISTCLMAKHYPNSRFIGLDISAEVIADALARAASQNITNVEFVRRSAEDMAPEWSNTFDFVFIYNGVHDAFHPDMVLRESIRVMKPNAKAVIHEPGSLSNLAEESSTPGAALRYGFSLFYCLPTSLHPPEDTPEADGMGLGTAWGKERCQQMLTETGFKVISVDKEIGGVTWTFYCTKSP